MGIGSPEELSKDIWKGDRVEIVVKNFNKTIEQAMKDLDCIKAFEYQNYNLKIEVNNTSVDNPIIIGALVNAGAQIISVEIKNYSLEEVYLNLVRD